ncbi:hypothetical protein BN59_02660 [Legionella massiliensis]|uniref:Uncharacterized protein n=1 Tax=Legionella massiliensis TaxID=1034943 RepID=A0A078KV83_9GAMM|nr:hypothetical protein [Legionella massiliensis]CDZ78350.1 hypothetical protein BN59_02660 [Legionella massiliensis]CEE14088.1 hypothetical protein BN1094_02660 [Legionella massiliensis]
MAYDRGLGLFKHTGIRKQEFEKYREKLDIKHPRNSDDPANTAPASIAETKLRAKGKDDIAEKVKKEFAPRWLQRMAMYDYFLQNYEDLVRNTTINTFGQGTDASPYTGLDFDTLSSKSPKIKEVREDGGLYTSKLKNPLMVIAGNEEAVPGSAYRAFAVDKKTGNPKGVGDAQEEKTTQTLCGGLVIAAIAGKEVTEEGDFKYANDVSVILDKHAALVATGLFHGEQKSPYGMVISCAPAMNDEEKAYYNLVEKEVADVGLTSTFSSNELWNDYIKEIHQMYQNLAVALSKTSADNIVLTLPGSGVYSRNSMHAKLIQGICLRMAFEVNPVLLEKAQADQIHLPFADAVVMAGFHLSKTELVKAYASNSSPEVKAMAESIDMQEMFDRVKKNVPGIVLNTEPALAL